MVDTNIGSGFKLINCQVYLDGKLVGGVQELDISREDENTIMHEAGNLNPIDIVSGKREFSGKVTHMWLDTKTIKDLQQFDSDSPFDDTYFNIEGVVQGNKANGRKVIVESARFKNLSLSMALDDITKIDRDFDALNVKLS